jgi:choice-of-anchor B domain-containing protein
MIKAQLPICAIFPFISRKNYTIPSATRSFIAPNFIFHAIAARCRQRLLVHTNPISTYFFMFKNLLLLSVLWCTTALSGINAQNFNVTFRSKMGFPGQTCANISGYAANGHEYALVGASKGLAIVEVTNPDAPVKLVQLPGPDNLWKEIKTYKHYAYVTSEGGQGVQIVDLSKLPAPNPNFKFYTGDGAIAGELSSIHALHIDTTAGYLYAFGSGLFSGGAVVLDLKDPYNPVYAGHFNDLGYIHDGWSDNDTLYAGHIYAGTFSIVNMKDKTQPVVLGIQRTPNAFTHNVWMSKDRTTIFATDEVDNSYLSAYNIQDPQDIKFLDKIQAQPGSNSMVHNTHILENYAITSWYSSGVSIVDVSHPDNLVQTGLYDVAPAWQGGGSNGCWGVYPYLPSGNLLATIITGSTTTTLGELWVITPEYKRACYIEGKITNATTTNPIVNALVEVIGGTAKERSAADGTYKTGQPASGNVLVKVSAPGYIADTIPATLTPGVVTVLNVALTSQATTAVTGQITDNTNQPIPQAKVSLNGELSYEATSDNNGNYTFPAVTLGKYNLIAGAWGYGYATKSNLAISTPQSYSVKLDKGYRDDFVFDYGWEVSGTSATGKWEIGEPVGVNVGIQLVPETDVNGDIGNLCYVTGNGSDAVGEDDVKSGTMILRSPPMDLTTYNDPGLRAFLFFSSITFNNESLDSIKIIVENGVEEKILFNLPGWTFSWQFLNKKIKPAIALTKNMRIRVECFNNPAYTGQDSYEAAFDWFRIVEGSTIGTFEADPRISLKVLPNPFHGAAAIEYHLPMYEKDYTLDIYDILGRPVESLPLSASEGMEYVGQSLPAGTYMARITRPGSVSREVKLIKIK